jgi:alcohol dehydrogenase class IV
VTADQIAGLVEPALADHCSATNPRKLTAPDMEGLFRAALS